jgi:hypothetical protein
LSSLTTVLQLIATAGGVQEYAKKTFRATLEQAQ